MESVPSVSSASAQQIVSVFVLTEKKFNIIIHAPGSHGEFIELMKTSGTKLLL